LTLNLTYYLEFRRYFCLSGMNCLKARRRRDAKSSSGM